MLVGGRLDYAPLSYGVKHSIILNKSCHAVVTYVRTVHFDFEHLGKLGCCVV